MDSIAATFDLECVGISKHFGDFVAVDNVSFRIPRGSFFSILGPSGCGKTTLLRMIAGFEEPSSGNILIKNKSALSLPPNKRPAKMVFQHLALFPMMNVADNIAYGLRCQGVSRQEINKRTAEVLARVGLPEAGGKEIHQLSGGQKQRIAIARCMALGPEVLLLDEPLGALDLKLREHMKVELKMLQRQFDTTFIYITHDQSEALVMSDRVAVMNNGKFEQIGDPQELYHQPASAFVAGFVGDSNRWHGRITAIADGDTLLQTEDGLALRVAGSHGSVGAAAEVFVRPEAISIMRAQDTAEGLPNATAGRVDSVLFNGANSKVLVRLPGGGLVEAALPPTGFADLSSAERICLYWPPSCGKCFVV